MTEDVSANQDAPAIQRYNTRRAEGLYPELLRCVAVPRWALALVDGRPYGGVTELTAHAAELTEGLTEAEVLLALADHPKIGQRVNTGWSRTEQSGVDNRDARLAEALHTGNVAYEQRFGHIYLVCATGRSGAELLADLTARLANEPAAEIAVVRAELGKIAGLRLARVLAEPEQPGSTERQA